MGSGRKLPCILLALLIVACSGEPRPVLPPGPLSGDRVRCSGRGSGRKLPCVLLALLSVACSGEPRPVVPPGPFSGDGEIPVFVVNHGWHAGVMVDAASAQQQIPQLAQRFPGLAWLEFGWGNRDFYEDRKSTRLNSSHVKISYAVFCLKK